jgi:hypothetical protein
MERGHGPQLERVVQIYGPTLGTHKQANNFGSLGLVAAEEARSCAGGEHAQVAARANAARTRARPAFGGWDRRYRASDVCMHWITAGYEDSTG